MRFCARALLGVGGLFFLGLITLNERYPKGLDETPSLPGLALTGLFLGALCVAAGLVLLKESQRPSS